MSDKFLTLGLIFIFLFSLFILHVLAVRIIEKLKLNILRQMAVVYITSALNLPLITTVFLINKSISSLIYAFIVFNAFAYFYFLFFNMGETARRVKILIEIKKGNVKNSSNLKEFYKEDVMVKNRLERLLGLNQVKLNPNNKYIMANRILFCGTMFMYSWRKVLGFEE